MEREPVSFSERNQPRQRKIIHCDCDCFYASIEMRDNPALRGKPIAVGGSPEFLNYFIGLTGLGIVLFFIGLVIYRVSIPVIVERLSA